MTLRVMTWNIRNGGRDRGAPDRLPQILEVIGDLRPDLLALQELRDFPRTGRLDTLSDRLGMRGFLAPTCFGQPVAVLVARSLPVARVAPVRRPLHHAAQRVTVTTDRGALTVLGTHLQPYSGTRRLWEAGWLAGALADCPLGLLTGDLNTLDPWSDHADRLRRLPPRYRTRHLRRDGRTVDTRAVARLARAGLVDLFRSAGEGPGETAPTTGVAGTEFSGMRLDYALATPALAALATRCWVPRGGAIEHASDHYPVLAEFDVGPAAGP